MKRPYQFAALLALSAFAPAIAGAQNGVNAMPPDSIRQPFAQLAQRTTHFATAEIIYNHVEPHLKMDWGTDLLAEQTHLLSDLTSLAGNRDALVALLKDPDPKLRTLALGALFQREDGRDLPLIASLMDDQSGTFPLLHFSGQQGGPPPRLTQIESPQTVGYVARAMIRFYLAAANLNPYPFSSGPFEKPPALDITPADFARYWSERAKLNYCASWFSVKLQRATRRTEPLQPEYAPDVQRVLAEIDALPSPQREWTRLYALFSEPLPDADQVVPVQSLIATAQAIGPEALMNFLQRKPFSNDPDLQFADTQVNSRKELFRVLSEFILRHAPALLRTSDADAVLALADGEPQKSQGNTTFWVAAAAELRGVNNPAAALTAIQEGLKRYPLRIITGAPDQSILAAALWRSSGAAQKQFLTAWFYQAGRPVEFLREIDKAARPDTPELLAALVADPQFARADWSILQLLLPLASQGAAAPLVSLQDIYRAQPNANLPNQPAVLESWRVLLRRHYQLPENPPPPPPLAAPTVVTQPVYDLPLTNPTAQLLTSNGRLFLMPTRGNIEMREAGSGQLLWNSDALGPRLWTMAFVEATQHLSVLDLNGRLHEWNVATKAQTQPNRFPNTLGNCVLNPAGTRLAVASVDGQLSLYDTATGQLLWRHPVDNAGALTFSPDGQQLAAGIISKADNTTTVTLFKTDTGEPIWQSAPTLDRPQLAYAPDGRSLAVVTNRNGVQLWDSATGKSFQNFDYPEGSVPQNAVFSRDGQWIAIVTTGRVQRASVTKIGIVNMASGAVAWEIQSPDTVAALAFSPDGKRLYTAGPHLKAWPLESTSAPRPPPLDNPTAAANQVPSAQPPESGVTLLSVAFSGGSTMLSDDGIAYDATQYVSAAGAGGPINAPYLYVSGSVMAALPVIRLAGSANLPARAKIRGLGPDGINFPATAAVIDPTSREVHPSAPINASIALPGRVTKFYDPFSADWQISFDDGTTWEDAGTSATPIFVSLAAPVPGTPLYDTTVHLAVGSGFGAALGQTAMTPDAPNPVSSPAAAASPDLQWLRNYLAGDGFYLDQENHNYEKATTDLNRVKTLLQTPVVVQGLGPAPLLDHIFRKYPPGVNTNYTGLHYLLVQTLNREWPRNPNVTALFARELQEGNLSAVIDLARFAPDIWSDDYIEPIVRVIEKTGSGFSSNMVNIHALELLDQHFPAWARQAATIGPRLRGAFAETSLRDLATGTTKLAVLAPPSANDDHGNHELWFIQVALLAFSHDPAVIAQLRPFLTNPRVISDIAPIPVRACDLAHDAILHILNEPGEFGVLVFDPRNPSIAGMGELNSDGSSVLLFLRYSRVKEKIMLPAGDTHETQWAHWDAANAALAQRLDAMPTAVSDPAAAPLTFPAAPASAFSENPVKEPNGGDKPGVIFSFYAYPAPPATTLTPDVIVKTASSLQYQIVQPGTGATAMPGMMVSVAFTCTFNGNVVNASRPNQPIQFILGAGRVIKGLDEGVSGMKVGEWRKLIIPPELGDSQRTLPSHNATVRYDVKLVEATSQGNQP